MNLILHIMREKILTEIYFFQSRELKTVLSGSHFMLGSEKWKWKLTSVHLEVLSILLNRVSGYMTYITSGNALKLEQMISNHKCGTHSLFHLIFYQNGIVWLNISVSELSLPPCLGGWKKVWGVFDCGSAAILRQYQCPW